MMFSTGWKFATGFYPLVDMPQAHGSTPTAITGVLFSLFGASWKTYVSTAALTNVVFAVTAYALLRHQGLGVPFAFLYAAGSAIVFAPPHAVPNYDQSSFLFSLLMIFFLLKGRNAAIARSGVYHALAVIMGMLAFFSKQIPFAYFAPLVLCLLIALPAARRWAAFWGIVGATALTLGFLGWVLSISRFGLADWLYYWIKIPLLLGKERGGEFHALTFFNLFNLGSLAYVFTLAAVFYGVLRHRKKIIGPLGSDQTVSIWCGVFFYAITFLFVRTAHNVIDQGIALIFIGTGLIQLGLSRVLPITAYRCVAAILLVLTVVDCTKFHLTSNLRHKVHGPFDFSVPGDDRVSRTIPALAGLNWAQPVAKNVSADDLLDRYAFLTGVSKNVIELDYLGYGSSPALVAAGVKDRIPSQYIQYGHSIPPLSSPEGQDFVRLFYSVLADNELEWVISRTISDDPAQLFSKPILDKVQCEQRTFPNFVAIRLCPGKLRQELDWIYSQYKDISGRG